MSIGKIYIFYQQKPRYFRYAVSYFRYAVSYFRYAASYFRYAVSYFRYAASYFRYAASYFRYAVSYWLNSIRYKSIHPISDTRTRISLEITVKYQSASHCKLQRAGRFRVDGIDAMLEERGYRANDEEVNSLLRPQDTCVALGTTHGRGSAVAGASDAMMMSATVALEPADDKQHKLVVPAPQSMSSPPYSQDGGSEKNEDGEDAIMLVAQDAGRHISFVFDSGVQAENLQDLEVPGLRRSLFSTTGFIVSPSTGIARSVRRLESLGRRTSPPTTGALETSWSTSDRSKP